MEPYLISSGREGARPTTITTEQRMFDTEVYCLEMKEKFLAALKADLAVFEPTVLFMHEAVFGEMESAKTGDVARTPLKWWEEGAVHILEGQLLHQKAMDARPPEDKVREYLNNSTGTSSEPL